MAKGNKRNRPVTKKDQNVSSKKSDLFEGTTFSKNADENDPKILDYGENGAPVVMENKPTDSDLLKMANDFVENTDLEKVDRTNNVSDNKFDEEALITENSVLDQNTDSQEKVYQSGEIVSWDFAEDSAPVNETMEGEDKDQNSQKSKVENESSLIKELKEISQEIEKVLPVDKFSINKPVYIEIHCGNIFHYFSSGLISPAKYLSHRAFPDLQTINNDYLVLVNSHSHSSSVDHILLEVELGKDERGAISIHDNFALLEIPLPVSKIKTILVQDILIKEGIIKDALLFNGGFIPEKLIKVRKLVDRQQFNVNRLNKGKVKDYTKMIDKFDRILGLLAFVRNYDVLVSPKTNSYKTLPNHFFYAMQVLDESFGAEIIPKSTISEFYSYLFNDSCPDEKKLLKWIFNRINVNENFTDVDTVTFGNLLTVVNDDPQNIRKNYINYLSKNLERKRALKLIDESKSRSQLQLYIFAFLRNYGNLNSIEISRKDIESVYSHSYGEYAFAVLGYFYGYRNLSNSDERINLPKIFSPNGTTKPAVKFKFTTKFDYLVFEQVYRFAFKEGDENIHYPIHIPEDLEEEKPLLMYEMKDYRIYQTVIYGKLYQNIAFSDPFDTILEEVSKLPEEIPLIADFGVYCYKVGINIKPIYISNIHQAGSIYERACFSKTDLYNYLKENRKSVDVEEIQMRLQLSKKDAK